MEGSPDQIAVPIVWMSPEDVPILFANAFVCQFDQTLDSHLITIGQITPPALIRATREELRAQAEQVQFVPVKPVARLAVSPARLQELLAILHANVDQLDRVTTMRPGDPR